MAARKRSLGQDAVADIESTDDLDDLYAGLGKSIEENPEDWL